MPARRRPAVIRAILALLAASEHNVKDLSHVLMQSQPRISRHLKLLVDAGLVERFREGSWVYLRLADRSEAGAFAADVMTRLAKDDAVLRRDRDRAQALLAERSAAAQAYFAQHAAEWDRTHEALSMITGETERLQSNPALARSIAHRLPYLDPLNHLQVELLRRYRSRRTDDPPAEVARVQRGIHLSINGLAAGLRNTG